ncbi:hydroxymethylglutaryl-CoA synthase [Desulfurococcaceae archaeon AG1]|nr:hydroxymethylglutaryl-CoA synthase [Desulfurococcaceae archaeon AG1]
MSAKPQAGIMGWGAYIPLYRLRASEIARIWGYDDSVVKSLWIEEKAVGGVDEDTITIGWEASRYALMRAKIDPGEVGAVFVGTESKPYAVKPSATIIAEALGIPPQKLASDLEFACRAASEAMRISVGLIASGMIKASLVIGADTAQASPGDVLEFTASSGGAAFVIGDPSNSVAIIEDSYSYITDTPDFWRREGFPYPEHGEAFTGEPAYFSHIMNAVKGLLDKSGLRISDFDYVIFHQPNGKFPLQVGSKLGVPREKILPGIVTPYVGNTYNGSALLGLARVLDMAKPGSRILLAPFGSGAGSDAFSILVLDRIEERRALAPTVDEMIKRKSYIPYGEYVKVRRKIVKA